MHGLVASLLFSTCGADSAVVDWTIFQKEITVGGDQCVYSTNGEVSYEGTLEYKDGEKKMPFVGRTRGHLMGPYQRPPLEVSLCYPVYANVRIFDDGITFFRASKALVQ